MKLRALFICLSILLLAMVSGSAAAQRDQDLPIILSFDVDLESITLEDVENGSEIATFNWQTLNMSEDYRLLLYAYEIGTWALINDDSIPPLDANGELQVAVRHPLNFNPPSYRLIITDEQFQVYSEAVVSIPYNTESVAFEPSIATFNITESSIEADTLAYGEPRLTVSWQVTDRSPSSNLVFEQVQPDGTAVSVELSRRNLWVTSQGDGAIAPVLPSSGNSLDIRLRLVDLISGETLDEASQQVQISGAISTPTPIPPTRVPPTQAPQEEAPPAEQVVEQAPAQEQAAPVVSAGTGGGFELGGHIASLGGGDTAREAGMTWIKQQIRWRRGDDTGLAAGIINGGHSAGFKVLLAVVGEKSEMGDYEAYTNDFANYLGQVAALGPDAIEVWNEPNIDREWPAGSVSGSNYTVMLSKAYNAIKSTNSNVMVISGAPAPTGFFGGTCTANGCDDNVFLRQMANAGAAQYMDCVGAHYNEGIISPDQTSGDPRGGHYSRYFVGMLNLYYNTFGGARQVCWTELGFLTSAGYGPLPGGFAWAGNTTIEQHAEWLGLAARRSRESGRVRMMIVWNVDFTVYDSDPQGGYAIRRPDGSCPACATLSAAMQ